MKLNPKYAIFLAALLSGQGALADGNPPIDGRPSFFVTAQFLNVCDTADTSFSEVVALAEAEKWSKISEPEIVTEFFPKGYPDFESVSIFEYSASELNRMNEDIPLTEDWFLAVATYQYRGRLATMCQIRSYAADVSGLRVDFENTAISSPSNELVRETVSSEAEFEKYVYFGKANNSFYNVWERRVDDGEFVFALSKTYFELNP